MKRKITLAVLTTLLALAPSAPSHAMATSIDVINFKPAVDGMSFITTYSAHTRPKREWNVGFYLDYAKNPLELASPQGTRRAGVVDDTLIMNLIGSYSPTDWFLFGVRVPAVFWNNYQGLVDSHVSATPTDAASLGDVGLDLKFRLVGSKYATLGIIPFVNFPTGKASRFMGSGTVTGGGKLALDIDPHERVKIGLNAGYEAKDDVTIRGARMNDMFLAALAINVKAHRLLDLIADAHTETVVNNFFSTAVTTPAEIVGAARIHATQGIDVTVGGGAGLTVGVGSPDYRAFLGLNYTHHDREKPAPAKIEAKKITIDQMVHFDFDKYNIKKDSYAILDDVASILKNNPQIKKVRVEGHTDAIGSDAYNMKLSQRRANSVRDYLVNKGIDGSRLESVGYGKTRPIATNKTAAGRAQNRRTEFNVVEQ